MTFITSNQGRPIQGVSQQPDKTRLPGQCNISDNFRPDIVRGLITRQGTEASAKLTTAPTSNNDKWHFYDRGTGEEYFISIEAGTGKVRAYSPDGTEHNITVEDNAEVYLAESNARENIVAKTIGDYTFLVNKTWPVLESPQKTPSKSHKAIVYVQFMDYSQSVRIFIDDEMVAIYNSENGETAAQKITVNPDVVINFLKEALGGGFYIPDGSNLDTVKNGRGYGWWGIDITTDYTFYVEGNTIVIERKDENYFEIKVTDDVDNANAVAIQGKLNNTTLLPGDAPAGYVIEIEPPGSGKSDNSSFFLEAETTDGDHITWKETLGPNISIGPDPYTLPRVLVREFVDGSGVAYFTLRRGEWSNREVGDDRTNPHPTFIDTENPRTIQSIGLFQNRLFFTAGEAVIMTRSNDFFNFYRESAQASLDTDPVDVYADVPEVQFLNYHVSFDGDLVFFSNSGQFIMDGSKPVTKDNATLRLVTSFETQLSVNPVASGDNVFFAFKYGQYTGVREFFVDSITDTKKARPVTDHVKQYVKGVPTIMETSTNLNLLILKTDDADNVLYTHDWLWQGNDKVQNAWGRIIFPEGDKILSLKFINELLWIVLVRAGGEVYIEKVDMGDPVDSVLGYPVRLDRRTQKIIQYFTARERWEVVDPYPDVPIEDLVLVRRQGAYESEIGTPIDFERDGNLLVSYEELADLTKNTVMEVIIGTKYKCIYSPTNPVALDEQGYALNLDRLTIGNFYINYNTTGEMVVKIDNKLGAIREYEYNNRTLGGPENLVGFAPLVEGQHRIPIRQKSDRYKLSFETESHIPLEIRDFEYNGNLYRRGRRI